MGVRFIIGQAGSGKTALCAREIGEESARWPIGPPLFWLVPEQGTFDAERMLLTGGGGRGSFRAQVLSFRRLAMMVGKELGFFAEGERGTPKPMDEIARRVLLEEVVRRERGQLKVFAGAAEREGFITHLDAMMRELRQHGHSGATLRKMLDEQRAGMDAVTRLKMMDLAHLLEAWEAEMTRSGDWDFEQMMVRAAERMGESALITGSAGGDRSTKTRTSRRDTKNAIEGARVWVDAFSAMTALEVRMMGALGEYAGEVTITLLADPDSAGIGAMREVDGAELFARTERLYRRLVDEFRGRGVPVAGTVALREGWRFLGAGVRRVESELFEDSTPRHQDTRHTKAVDDTLDVTAGVELWECSEPETEVRMVAQEIRRMALAGTRYRQVAVIVPELGEAGEYQDAVRRIFREHAIPHFIDERRSMGHHPVVELVRSAVAAVTSGFGRDEMLLYLKTQLAGVDEGAVAEVENYVWSHGITRVAWDAPWPWLEQNQREDEETAEVTESARARLRRVNQVRAKVWADLSPFAGEVDAATRQHNDAAGYVRALRGLLGRLDVEAQVKAWVAAAQAKGDAELAQVHEQVWKEVDELLALLERVLAGRERTLLEFERLLASALGQLTLGLIPPTVDQVLVSSVTRSRVPEMDAVFVLGAVEGSFPKVVEEDPILSDAQRAAFNALAADPIGEGSDRQLLEMPFFDYVAMTRARRRLVVSHPVADRTGRALAPSRYVAALRELLGEELVRHSFDAASRADVGRMCTVEDVMLGVAAWGRAQIDATTRACKIEKMAGVYNWVLGEGGGGIADSREVVRRALAPRVVPALSAEMAERFFPAGRAIRMSVSRLEKYAACPSQYFHQYMLHLEPREELVLDSLEMGSLQHNILEGLYRRIIAKEFAWPACDAAVLRQALEQEVDRGIAELHAELAARTPGYDKMRLRIIRTLGVMVEGDRQRAAAGRFVPTAVELTFGQGASAERKGRLSLPVLKIKTPAGRTLALNGKMDRMDVSDAGKLGVVIDYKSGAEKKVNLNEVHAGLMVQLPVYALVARELAGLEPAGAFLVSLGMKRKSVAGAEAEAAGPADEGFYQQFKPRGFLNAARGDALDRALEPKAGGATGEGESRWYSMGYTQKNAMRARSDMLSAEDFAALLAFTERKIGTLADRLAKGEIGPLPFKNGNLTPCEWCEFRSLCAFDGARDKFAVVGKGSREDVIRKMTNDE